MAEEILNQVHVSNMFDLRGVVAVVTGGGSVCDNYSMIGSYLMASVQGIGLMISTTLISNGATVFIVGPGQADLDRCAKTLSKIS